MANLPSIKSVNSFSKTIRERLASRTGITHWAYDSTSKILSDTISIELSQAVIESREAFKSIQVPTAAGADLEALAFMPYGLDRNRATFAQVKATHKSLSFYTATGTFGAINNGASIQIPAGTVISSEPVDTIIESRIDYRTVENVILPVDESLVYVNAIAVTAGTSHNVGERALVYHAFTGYADAAKASLRVTNRYSILNGQNEENDERLRFRISRQYASLVQNNLDNIKLTGIDVPGLEDVRVIPGYFGIGTAACFTYGIDEESNQQLADALQQKLVTIQGPGLVLMAVPGVTVYIDLELRIRLAEALSSAEQFLMQRAVRKTLFDSLKSNSSRRSVNLKAVANDLLRTHPDIIALIPNTHSLDHFEAAYLRKMTAGSNSIAERKKLLVSSFSLEEEEAATLGTLDIVFETAEIAI